MGENNARLEQAHLPVKFKTFNTIIFFGKADERNLFRGHQSLVSQVMDSKDTCRPGNGTLVQQCHKQACLPVVCHNHVRVVIERAAEEWNAPGKKDKPLTAVKIFPVRSTINSRAIKKFIPTNHIEGNPRVDLSLKYVRGDLFPAEFYGQCLGKHCRSFCILKGFPVRGDHQGHLATKFPQCRRQCPYNVAQAPCFCQWCRL